MKAAARRSSVRTSLRWTQRALFAGAFLMLGYCAFVLADAWILRKRGSDELALVDRPNAATSAQALTKRSRPPAAVKGLVGRIDIARLGLSVIVMDGTTAHTLRRAAGHIDGTAFPGEHGNVGISGHRDTLFRPLRNIRRDDIVTFTTPAKKYRYRVVSTKIVGPDAVSVLDSNGSDILTLVTCYPFYFVGPAPERFIVRAERVADSKT
jgi:sortase A